MFTHEDLEQATPFTTKTWKAVAIGDFITGTTIEVKKAYTKFNPETPKLLVRIDALDGKSNAVPIDPVAYTIWCPTDLARAIEELKVVAGDELAIQYVGEGEHKRKQFKVLRKTTSTSKPWSGIPVEPRKAAGDLAAVANR